MKKIMILLTAMMSLTVVVGCSNESTGTIQEMSSEELQKEYEENGLSSDSVYYLDVREEDEFSLSHISGFENIPMGDVIADPSVLPEDKEIVILCNTQNRSMEVGKSLVESGFSPGDITIVLGGIASYEGEKVENG